MERINLFPKKSKKIAKKKKKIKKLALQNCKDKKDTQNKI
jgi:hypothetical protein